MLNRLAAEFIIGCRLDRHCIDVFYLQDRILWTGGHNYNPRYEIFTPTSCWSSVGRVIEEMNKKGYQMTLEIREYECIVCVVKSDEEKVQVTGHHIPKVITLASLKALGVKGVDKC